MTAKYIALVTKDNIDHCLSFIIEEGQKKKLLALLSKLDIKISNIMKIGKEFGYKISIVHKFNKKRVYIIEDHFHKSKGPESKLNLADVIEVMRDKTRKIKI